MAASDFQGLLSTRRERSRKRARTGGSARGRSPLQGLIDISGTFGNVSDAAEIVNTGLLAATSPEFRERLRELPRGLLADGQRRGIEQATTLDELRDIAREPVMNPEQLQVLGALSPAITARALNPRFAQGVGTSAGNPRVRELPKLQRLSRQVDIDDVDAPIVRIEDFEGRPFISHFSDRTDAGGVLTGVNDVDMTPVSLQGGQDFMFHNPGQVWAGAQGPVSGYMNQARALQSATGQNPIWLPWRMAPTGSDFSTMTAETLSSFASANMRPGAKRSLNAALKKVVPGWQSVDDPDSFRLLQGLSGDQRKRALNTFDKFRERGGLSVSEARAAITDPRQLEAPNFGLMNVGEIDATRAVVPSVHNTYPFGVPGQGIGLLDQDLSALGLLDPASIRGRGFSILDAEGSGLAHFMRRKPITGTIDEPLLRRLGL